MASLDAHLKRLHYWRKDRMRLVQTWPHDIWISLLRTGRRLSSWTKPMALHITWGTLYLQSGLEVESIWCWADFHHTGRLQLVQAMMSPTMYQDILEMNLLPSARMRIRMRRVLTFQQDNEVGLKIRVHNRTPWNLFRRMGQITHSWALWVISFFVLYNRRLERLQRLLH